MASVVFENASRVYPGTTKPAVDKLNLSVKDGEFLVLVGPSGCGKSTSLRMLAGLEECDTGTIKIGDKDVTNVAPKDRDIAMVFQSYALYPHMSVAENMGFALKIAGVAKEERDRRVREAAKLLDLEPYLDRKPKALSGGQRQRVAMGRAIVREPQVFLMDEPLSNLDAKLRVTMRGELKRFHLRLETTTVYVTHDQLEAMTMSDRIAVMDGGAVQQYASPDEVYNQPANTFVAGFIGSPPMNFLAGAQLHDQYLTLPSGQGQRQRVARSPYPSADRSVLFGIRPQDIALSTQADAMSLPARVSFIQLLGSEKLIDLTWGDGATISAQVRADTTFNEGQSVWCNFDPARLHLFDPSNGRNLACV
jgi:multiple sugar transport system ATP-binding protein